MGEIVFLILLSVCLSLVYRKATDFVCFISYQSAENFHHCFSVLSVRSAVHRAIYITHKDENFVFFSYVDPLYSLICLVEAGKV